METSSGVDSPQGGAAWSGPVPPGGEEPPDSVSCPFSSRNFSYLIKNIENINGKVFREPFLTRTVTYSKTNSAGSYKLSWMNSSRETISITATSSL
jgi:hypothetical protein